MQGQGMAGERRPVYLARIHWMGGDNVVMGGSNETPRLSVHRRGVWIRWVLLFFWPWVLLLDFLISCYPGIFRVFPAVLSHGLHSRRFVEVPV